MTTPDRAALKARYGDEQVLVIPAQSVMLLPTGVTTKFDIAALLQPSSYLPRWQAEYNPNWRQLVTYITLRQGKRLFLTQRFKSQGESRLHSLYSVGVGGHVNSSDAPNPLVSGWCRELAEELLLDWSVEPLSPAGLINDLSNPVSQDHLGVWFILDIPRGNQVMIRETDKMHGQLQELGLIFAEYYDRLESWSQLVVNFLEKAQI